MDLLKAKEAAEAASRAKSECLASLSHAVRTATYSIIGTTDGLLAAELKPEQRAGLSAINESAQSLLKILDETLECFKIAER